MKIYKTKMPKGSPLFLFALTFLQLFILCFATCVERPPPRNMSVSRDHVAVWFNSPLGYGFGYERNNCVEMINLVGETFGTIVTDIIQPMTQKLVPPETLNDSVLLIPGIVAQRNNKYRNRKMKVMIPFTSLGQEHEHDSNFTKSIQVAKFIADRANKIHPGTVDTLLLMEWSLNPLLQEGFDFKEEFTAAVKSSWELINLDERGPHRYKFGIFLPIVDCGAHTALSEIIPYVDLIIPIISFEGNDDPLEENKMLTRLVVSCEQKLKRVKREMEVISMIQCGFPKNLDFAEVSKYLQCWQLMSDWARETNRTVILDKAFDAFSEHAGWWRIKTETPQVDKPQPVIEKVTASSFIAKADEIYGMNFNAGDVRSQAGIYFNYRISFYHLMNQYTDREISAMLELVSSRFSIITTLNTPEIADLVAKLNRKCQSNTSCQPLKIISMYSPQSINFEEGLEEELQSAQSANKLYHGTVPTVVLYGAIPNFINDTNLYDILRDLKTTLENEKTSIDNVVPSMTLLPVTNAQTTTLSQDANNATTLQTSNSPFVNIPSILSSTNISMGIYIRLSDCRSLKEQFHLVNKWVSVVIVDIPYSSVIDLHLYHIASPIPELLTHWVECQQNLKSSFPTVEVLLSVACSQLNSHIEQVAKCWELVNDWGKKNKVQVIFSQAFQRAYSGSLNGMIQDFEGWWKLKRNTEINITGDSFVETFHDLFWDSENCNAGGEPDSSPSTNDTNGAFSLFLFFLLIAITFGFGIAVWFYKYGKRYKPLMEDRSELQVLSK